MASDAIAADRELVRRFHLVGSELRQLGAACVFYSNQLRDDDAREYLAQGVSRRLGILQKSLANIFGMFPPGRSEPLLPDEGHEATINLHAYVMNAYGIQDNLAWVYVYENGIKLDRLKVGLFKKECKANFPKEIQSFLSEQQIIDWHTTYAKDYRDALAHRIPLYIPPAQYTDDDVKRDNELATEWNSHMISGNSDAAHRVTQEREHIGRAAPYFMHSHRSGRYVSLHAQLLADANTIRDLVQLFLKSQFKPSPANP